jgi:hypothetical protein
MPFDYSQTADPKDFSQPIPDGTIATVQMRIRPGGVGEDRLLKRTSKGDAEMLDCEFTVLDGEHARRKFWGGILLAGTTDGHKQMADTNRGRLKKILESARGIKAGDTSAQNLAKYRADLKDFDNIVFIARIGVEKGGARKDANGNPTGEFYADKNVLAAAIGPEHKDWHPVEQPLPFNGGGAAAAATPPSDSTPIAPPDWAS